MRRATPIFAYSVLQLTLAGNLAVKSRMHIVISKLADDFLKVTRLHLGPCLEKLLIQDLQTLCISSMWEFLPLEDTLLIPFNVLFGCSFSEQAVLPSCA